ncbi:MAG: type II secretion system F family protein [Dehalococcoidia bacterium]|jgi:tight adherence protein B|nr:type II secretion system F family protein [Dehalococcoidia bacterium]
MQEWIPIGVFVVGTVGVVLLYAAIVRFSERGDDKKLKKRLSELGGAASTAVDGAPESDLVKRRAAGPLSGLDRLLSRTNRGFRLERWLEQSGVGLSPSAVMVIAVAAAVVVGSLVAVLVRLPLAGLGAGAVAAAVPFIVVRQRRAGRLRRFEEHFPEALDLIGRAVRAGHGFTAGLKMAADELDDPVGPEFRKTFDEQNFGLPLKDALANLAERVPLLDVRFFATAVLIQRETGGNLAEILENLASVVRERFKILRQVRVHTAHGRFTAWVLLALPVGLCMALSVINPEHMNLLFNEPMGQTMLLTAATMQVIGYLWIKRVVRIEV